ncbi:MAG TPA: homoserine kinase [Balneolales bacterium]|nr:homoserine kinase [Balneolales bacterium]
MSKEKIQEVTAYAPGSVANVGCGFDVMGFAINEPGDEVTARFSQHDGVAISAIYGENADLLPYRADKNTAGVAVQAMLNALDTEEIPGIEIELNKKMPLGSGLGSSAASAVAAVVAVNQLLGNPFTKKELLPFAVAGEHISCGVSHADNAAASLMGGFIFVRSNNPLEVLDLPTPDELYCSIIHPDIEIRTEDTRRILRKQVSLSDAVTQWGNVGALVAALFMEDYELIGRSLHDSIIEPIRSILIPGYPIVKEEAIKAGALGCSISGSGPSIFALSRGRETAEEVSQAMSNAVKNIGMSYEIYISPVNKNGSILLDQKNIDVENISNQ